MSYAYLILYRDGSTIQSSPVPTAQRAWYAFRTDQLIGNQRFDRLNDRVFVIVLPSNETYRQEGMERIYE